MVLVILRNTNFDINFEDAINPLRSCGNFAESTTHFFLHCTHFSNQRLKLSNKIKYSFWRRETFHNREQIHIRSSNSVFNIFRKIWLTVVLITIYSITLNCIYFRANIFKLSSVTAPCLLNYYLNFSFQYSKIFFFLFFVIVIFN